MHIRFKENWIELPCEPHSDLDWTQEIAKAQTMDQVIWFFRLGLEQPYFPLEDEMRFNALSLALQRFTKEVYPQFAEKTLGLSLYRGPIPHFAMYFQMLAHKLPDEVPIWLLFEVAPALPHQLLQALSQDGLEHFKIALRGTDIPLEGYRWDDKSLFFQTNPCTTGVVFPTNCAPEFDQLLNGSVKIIFETFLAEQWDGLDRLLVLDKALTSQGRRMLKGFEAAGGQIVYY